MRPFEGIRVLDFTRIVSGPYCTQFLGFLGAEIVKIEDRAGDSTRHGPGDATLKKEGMSATFLMFNSGKKSVTLDLKIAQSVCQVPICPLYIRDNIYRSLAELRVGQRQVSLGYFNRPARLVETASAKERLGHAERQARI